MIVISVVKVPKFNILVRKCGLMDFPVNPILFRKVNPDIIVEHANPDLDQDLRGL